MNNILIYLLYLLTNKQSNDVVDARDDNYEYVIDAIDAKTYGYILWAIPYDKNQDRYILYTDKNLNKVKSFMFHHILKNKRNNNLLIIQ